MASDAEHVLAGNTPKAASANVMTIDLRTYCLLAVQKVLHRYGVAFRTRTERVDEHRLRVTFEPNGGLPLTGVPRLADLENHLIDQELREAVGAETLAVRNLILAQAFSATNLLDPVGESADPDEDPLAIRTPDRTRS